MHQARIAALLALACSGAAAGAAEPQAAADVAHLTRAACEAGTAYAARDLDTLDRLTADDYRQTDVRGGVLTRAQWREFVRNRKSVLTIECDDIEVRLYGPAAVVTGGWTYTSHKPEGDVVVRSRWTSMWTKERDDWKRHAFQNTYVNPRADQCAAEQAP